MIRGYARIGSIVACECGRQDMRHREARRMEFNPEPEAALRARDKLLVLGRQEPLRALELEAQS